MKWLGVFLILTAGTALGAEAGSSLRKRYQMLDELRLIIGLLKGELQYGAVPLEEIFKHLEQRTDGKLAIFFGRTAEEMKAIEKNSLEEVLKKTAAACLQGCGLTEKEQKQLVQICTLLGRIDRDAQISMLDGYLMATELEEKAALEKMRQKETMYRCLGFMGGLFCAVLFY